MRLFLSPGGSQNGPDVPAGSQWALLLLDRPVVAPQDSLLIGSVLDSDINANMCRLVFFGKIACVISPEDKEQLARLKIYKQKQKVSARFALYGCCQSRMRASSCLWVASVQVGGIKRVVDEDTVIGKDLFKKETDISMFIGAPNDSAPILCCTTRNCLKMLPYTDTNPKARGAEQRGPERES